MPLFLHSLFRLACSVAIGLNFIAISSLIIAIRHSYTTSNVGVSSHEHFLRTSAFTTFGLALACTSGLPACTSAPTHLRLGLLAALAARIFLTCPWRGLILKDATHRKKNPAPLLEICLGSVLV